MKRGNIERQKLKQTGDFSREYDEWKINTVINIFYKDRSKLYNNKTLKYKYKKKIILSSKLLDGFWRNLSA